MEDSTSVLIEQIIQHWNGTDWKNQNKTSIKYNQSSLKENEKIYGWNGSDWTEYKRTFYKYNSSNKPITIYTEELILNWDTTSISNYKYDNDGRKCESIVKYWDHERNVYSQFKDISNYTDDNLSEVIHQYYENDLWLNEIRIICKYDLNKNLTESLGQEWINDEWENNSSYNFIFDENSYKTKSVQLVWSNSVWDTLNMHLFINNENGLLIEETRKVKQEGVWVDDSIFSYGYNSDGKTVLHLFQYWADAVLLNGLRIYYEYNIEGYRYQKIEQGWRNDDWENNSKINYMYDIKGNLINKTYNNWGDGNWINTVKYLYEYDEITNITQLNNVINYYELANNYPNPFNPTTTIKYSIPRTSKVNLTIYTVLGEKLLTLVDRIQNKGVYKVIFNANSLTSGVYIYRINVTNEYSEAKKMLLMK